LHECDLRDMHSELDCTHSKILDTTMIILNSLYYLFSSQENNPSPPSISMSWMRINYL